MYDISAAQQDFEGSIKHLEEEISTLRTGRVSPSLVEDIEVEAYENKMPLMQVASISSSDPRTIVIQPWDKSVIKEIEQALQKSERNLQPVVDKDIIRLNFPALTEENRKELVKTLSKKAEEARVGIKQKREKHKDAIQSQEKQGELTEDEKFKALEELDKEVKKAHDKIKEIADKKEEEIMTI